MLFAAAQPASAQLVERSHDHIVVTFPDDEVCGVPVVTTVDVIDNSLERLAQSGFPLFQSSGHATVTFTNPENGRSMVLQFSGLNFKDLSATDNGDGTLTLRTAVIGVPERISLPGGAVVIMDVGRLVFVSVIDYNGTPTDTEDDETLSEDIEALNGPHPDLESDFELFCSVIIAGLT
jgi:hypothetical protein